MAEISKQNKKGTTISQEKISFFSRKIKSLSDLKEVFKESSQKTTSDLVETILLGAIFLDASDIHIEPTKENAKTRLRIDGILEDFTEIEPSIYESILSRIKLLSGMKLNISDKPQDGRFSVFIGKESIEMRVSTLPAEYGESVVLRVLNPKSLVELEELGLRKDLYELFQKEIRKPYGMIIVTGPTGSGKTTTLYAFLKKIQKPELKIITIEDPIEYHLEGISQTQVNPEKGYDFASGLQSIMRQDPDVILVGEIRNLKTCKIAIQAALTGHLVFSTLHANNAAGTISRLLNLGEEAKNLGPAINLTIAQRLVRKVCKECSVLETIPSDFFQEIKKSLPNAILKKYGVGSSFKIAKAKGCKTCNYTGYKGRIGIFEAMAVDNEMEKIIMENPSMVLLEEKAIKRGMITIRQDGLIRVLERKTTIEELERIASE